jgi:hypothetical protein
VGAQKRIPDMRSLFLSKVPVNVPLQVPLYRAPMQRDAVFKASFYISLEFFIKMPQNKEMYPFSQGA